MLTLTDDARTAVTSIVTDSALGATGGVRIAEDGSGGLAMTLAAEPAVADAVIDEEGVRVFLDETANSTLEDKTLDAVADENGAVRFALTIQQ